MRAQERVLLDRLGADGCPPLEQLEVDGWRLRAAHGVLRRANSALPLSDALPIDAVVDFYRTRGLPARVQVTSVTVDLALAERGWARDLDVSVMTGPVPTGPSRAAPSRAVLSPTPDDAWVDVYWAVDGRGGPAAREVFVRMLGRIAAPVAYAGVEVDGTVGAVGRAVAQEGHLGIYAMAVLPDLRGRGLGREVLHALGDWGAGQGARTAHLQVLSDNTAAQALYTAAGLRPAHSYHYRSLP